MSTQSPLPQNDPLLIAFQQLKHTPEYRNAVNWTIKAENENHADGELWFAFAAGWNARNALAATPADPVREAATALVNESEVKRKIFNRLLSVYHDRDGFAPVSERLRKFIDELGDEIDQTALEAK